MTTLDLLMTWNLDPALLLVLAAVLGGYLAAIGPLRARGAWGPPVPRGRAGRFVAGWILLALCVISPLDVIGQRYLFLAHTLQLFVITTVAAPLLLLGLPEWLMERLLPLRVLRQAVRASFFPVVAIVVYNGVILGWHITSLYEAALHNAALHDLQLLCWLLVGVANWWPLPTPLDQHARMSNLVQLLYLTVESISLDVFGIIVIFLTSPLYPTYVKGAPMLGVPALADQQIGGVLFAVPGNIFDLVLMSIVFFGWIGHIERQQRAQDLEQYGDALQIQPASVSPESVGE